MLKVVSTLLKWLNYCQKIAKKLSGKLSEKAPKKIERKSAKKATKLSPKNCLKSKEFKNSMALLEFSVCKSDFGNRDRKLNPNCHELRKQEKCSSLAL